MNKTKKAVSSRFRMNKKGKIKRFKSGRRHLLAGKSRSRKRHMRKSVLLGPADESRIRRFLPHG